MRSNAILLLFVAAIGTGVGLGMKRLDEYGISCTNCHIKGAAPAADYYLQDGDVVRPEPGNEKPITFHSKRSEFTEITVEGSDAKVVADAREEADITAICLDLQGGKLHYLGEPQGKSTGVGAGGRKYIVRRRGFALGAVGTEYTLECTSSSNAKLTVQSGTVAVISPWPYAPIEVYRAGSPAVVLDPSEGAEGFLQALLMR